MDDFHSDSLPKIGRRRLFMLIGIGAGLAVCALAVALAVRVALDLVVVGGGRIDSALPAVLATLAVATVIGAMLTGIERGVSERLGQEFAHEARSSLYAHLSRVSPALLASKSRGAVSLRFTGDLSALRRWVSLGVARLVVASVAMTLSLVGLYVLHWLFASVVAASVVCGVLLSVPAGTALQRRSADARRERGRVASLVVERIGAMATVHVHGSARRERRRQERRSRKLTEAMVLRARAIGVMRAIAHATSGLALLGIVATGVWLCSVGATTVGATAAATLVVGFMSSSMLELARSGEYWREALVGRANLERVMKLPAVLTNSEGALRGRSTTGKLEFRGVSVEPAFREVTAVAPAGSFVAVVGPNGSGKTSLLRAAARITELDRGAILLDGAELNRLSLGRLRRSIAIVDRDVPLLRGSLDWNLRYRRPDADSDELKRIRAVCRVDEVVRSIPDGLNARLQEAGNNLSLGERQRVLLARALLDEPAVLLLDEPTANLDEEAQAAVRRALVEFDGTVVVATHDSELVSLADRVWTMREGRLVAVESGALEADRAQKDWILPPPRALDFEERRRLPRGRVFAVGDPSTDPDALVYLPCSMQTCAEVLVLVHGISRAPYEHIRRFASHAERYGVALVAPCFMPVRDRGYQRLADAVNSQRADARLDSVLSKVERAAETGPGRVSMFGYSGGAQFVHRYCMRYPGRVRAAAIAAAGWYTQPSWDDAWPLGLGGDNGVPPDQLERFLSIPMAVLVGGRDVRRDSALRKSKRIDRVQGGNRLDRARSWVEACRAAADARGLTPQVGLQVLDGCAHSFRRCDERGDLVARVTRFLFEGGSAGDDAAVVRQEGAS